MAKGSVKVETVNPEAPYSDGEIIKKTDDQGNVTYGHPVTGGEVKTGKHSLVDIVEDCFCKMSGLVDLLNDEMYATIGGIFNLIMEDANQQLVEAFAFVDKTIGHIELDVVRRGSIYRPGWIVGITITPPEKVEEVNHEPKV